MRLTLLHAKAIQLRGLTCLSRIMIPSSSSSSSTISVSSPFLPRLSDNFGHICEATTWWWIFSSKLNAASCVDEVVRLLPFCLGNHCEYVLKALSISSLNWWLECINSLQYFLRAHSCFSFFFSTRFLLFNFDIFSNIFSGFDFSNLIPGSTK